MTSTRLMPRNEHAPLAASSSWLVTGSNLEPEFGGISSVVSKLGSAVAAAGPFQISVAKFGNSGVGFPLADLPWISSSRPWSALSKAVQASDGIHIHGIWQKHCALTGFLARQMRKPYLLSAHGMLDSWALGEKRLKKAIFTALIEARNLRGAACLHALTMAEAADYRKLSKNTPIAVVPNGVEIPDSADSSEFLNRFPHLRNRQIILFLGRLHAKKGVDILVQAWSKIQARWPDAHLVFAGPDYEGTRSRLEALVASFELTSSVTFTGMLQGSEKWSALAAAHCFVLPSYSEGLSVSVLEAMGSGVPVLITPQCHLPEVAAASAGWITESRLESLAPALDAALAESGDAWKQRAANGRALVARNYSWPVVGAQMAALYSWVLGGPRPSTVEIL